MRWWWRGPGWWWWKGEKWWDMDLFWRSLRRLPSREGLAQTPLEPWPEVHLQYVIVAASPSRHNPQVLFFFSPRRQELFTARLCQELYCILVTLLRFYKTQVVTHFTSLYLPVWRQRWGCGAECCCFRTPRWRPWDRLLVNKQGCSFALKKVEIIFNSKTWFLCVLLH